MTRVQFSDSIRVEIIDNVKDSFSEHEIRLCWYTKAELNRQKELQKELADALKKFHSDEELFERFGIHNKQQRSRRRMKNMGYMILLSQRGQFCNLPSTSEDVISLLYSSETKVSADIARAQASRLEEQVRRRSWFLMSPASVPARE
jgi:hypothetical protein